MTDNECYFSLLSQVYSHLVLQARQRRTSHTLAHTQEAGGINFMQAISCQ